ncbi:CAHM6 protein, partial [Corythaixoides concolor]|nr:CAHM6 protein [Corythaixoides concolor]
MDKLQGVLNFCIRHQTVLGYSLVSLLTAVTEQIFSYVVFQCPCNSGNRLYGSVFLIVPAFILFLLGYMVNIRMWRLLTGSCPPDNGCSCSLWGTCACNCLVLLQVTARASVAPLTWIAVALLRASLYECAASGTSLIKQLTCKDDEKCHNLLVRIPCDEKLSKNISSESISLRAQSQLIGWFLIASIMTVALISTCVSRCCSSVSYLQLRFWEIYSEKEQELFDIKAKEHANRLAERNTNFFFKTRNDSDPALFQTPSNEDWRKISCLYTLNSQEQYYSMLHKYVNTNRGNSIQFGEGDQNPPVFQFVAEASARESGF